MPSEETETVSHDVNEDAGGEHGRTTGPTAAHASGGDGRSTDAEAERTPDDGRGFLAGGGEMGERIRTFDWSRTPLGPIETWPASLRVAVGTMLCGRSPMALYWGRRFILLYNDTWGDLIGDRHPQALGRPARDVLRQYWLTMGPLLAQVMAEEGRTAGQEHLLPRRKDGATPDAWFNHTFTPVRCDDGSIGGVLSMAVETTERVRAEERVEEGTEKLMAAYDELRVSTEQVRQQNLELQTTRNQLAAERHRYQELFMLAPEGYLVTDDQGVVEEANQAAAELLGVPQEFLPGKPLNLYVAKDHRPAFHHLMKRARRDGIAPRRVEEELRLAPRDRNAFPAVVSVVSRRDRAGESVGLRWIVRDVSERWRVEEQLAEAERQYGELVRHAPAGIYEIDFRKNRFTYVNDAICQMLGYSEQELLTMSPFELLDEDGRARFQARINQWLRGEEPEQSVEFRVETRAGETIEAILDVTFTTGDEGRPLGATVIAHDITERKARERRIERYNRVLRGINRIFEQVIQARTEEALAETCLDVALEVTGSRIGFVGEIGDDGLIHDLAISDVAWDQCTLKDQAGHRRPPGGFVPHGLHGRIIDEGKGLIANDPPSHPGSLGVPDGHPPLTSFLGVPLSLDGETTGILAVANRAGGYGQAQLEDLEALAPAVVEALQRRRAEEDLRSERQLLQTIYDTIPVMLTIYDPRLEDIYLNKYLHEATGWTPEDVAETHIMELVYPDPAYRREVAAYMQSLEPGFRDLRVVTKDGRTLETSWANVRLPDGRQVGIGIDITERKRAEEALRRYTERLRFLHEVDEAILAARSAEEVAEAVVERIPRLIPCHHASVTLYDPQPPELSVLAVGPDDEIGLAGWHGPVYSAWEAPLEQLKQGERFVIADLQELSVSSALMARLQEEGVRAQVYEPVMIRGQLVGILSVSTRRPGPPSSEHVEVVRELALVLAVGLEQARLYEEVQGYAGQLERLVELRTAALEASEARFRTMFEEAAIGIALAAADGDLKAANPALQRLLGYTEEELVGRCFFDLVGHAGERGEDLFEELHAGVRTELTEELAYRRRDGEEGDANVTVSLLEREAGQAPLVLALVEDVTEQKRTRQMLIEAERLTAMGRMGASLAHEINNPLQSVIGCLGLAAEVQEEGSEAEVLLDVALEELLRASNIVRRMRDISRPGDGEREPADVRELIEKVVTLTHNQAENQNVQVIWDGAEDLPSVPIIQDQIQQVFLNLVLNAIDAMLDGGELRIQAARTEEPPGVAVAFADTGVGIPPNQLDHLFEAFHSTKGEGLGLGLYVTRNIIQEHGGWIEVESEVGEGTSFTVWLPDEAESPAADRA